MRFTSAVSSLLLLSAASATPITVEERAVEARAVPVGQVISKCTVPGTVALTFDDGPHAFTQKALNLLQAAGMKATFFVNGENWSKITDRKPAIDRIMAEGHQLGSHTYSHVHLPQLNDQQIRDEMIRLENTLLQMKGKFPTYMRPPYFEWDARSLSVLGSLGYKVIHADIDTLDWANNTPETFQKSVQNFRTGLDQGGRLTLAHDVHHTTVNYLLPEMIQIIKNRGLRAVTVGECLGDPAANWYRGARSGAPPPTTNPGTGSGNGPIGPGGACGGAQKYMCASGQCCSQYGYCGTTGEYCGAGCNPLFGRCN